MKSKASNAMPALSKFLILLAKFLLASYAHAFTSLSPVAGNQARVNHLIRFVESMSDPTNKPSHKPIREPTKRMDLDAELPNNLSPKKPQEVDSKPKQNAELPSNIASTQPHGLCHDKKSERDGNGASTQSRGLCHDKKSKRVTFNKQEKDAVLLYNFLSKHTQHSNHYKEEPLQKHCCTDLGIQSKLIFTSEKTNGCQQLTHSANSEGGRLASLLLSVHKSVGFQPTSLKTAQRAIGSKCKSFQDNVSIDS